MKRIISLFCIVTVIFGLFTAPVYADDPYFTGSGTADDPFIIATADDLVKLGQLTEKTASGNAYTDSDSELSPYMSAHYKITNDIDMTGKTFNGIGATGNGGKWNIGFAGKIDGDGHVVKNVNIDLSSWRNFWYTEENNNLVNPAGFIACTGDGALVKNLGIENIKVTSGGGEDAAGGLIGQNLGDDVVIDGCYVKNAILNGPSVDGWRAGIVGRSSDTDCYVEIKNCYTRNITTDDGVTYHNGTVAGIIARKNNNDTATIYVKPSNTYTVENFWGEEKVNKYMNCAKLTGDSKIHGGWLTNATGGWVSPWADENPLDYLGSAFIADTININNGYPILKWQLPLEGKGTSSEPYLIETADDLVLVGKLTAKNAKGAAYSHSSDNVSPYMSACYKITSDIDMSGREFYGIGATGNGGAWNVGFRGTIDGDGHIVRNVNIDLSSWRNIWYPPNNTNLINPAGFISATGDGAVIKNLGIENITVKSGGGDDGAGGLIGDNLGNATVDSCFVKGAVLDGPKNNANRGGIVGSSDSENKIITVTNCYATDITTNDTKADGGSKEVVGLVAKNSGNNNIYADISNVYTVGCHWGYPNNWKSAVEFSADSVSVVNGWLRDESGNKVDDLSTYMYHLGSEFVVDEENINGGYPVLDWEDDRPLDGGKISAKNLTVDTTVANQISGTFKLRNKGLIYQPVAVCIVVYGDDNEMLCAKIYDITGLDSGEIIESVAYDMSISEPAKSVKLYLWKGLTDFSHYNMYESIISSIE